MKTSSSSEKGQALIFFVLGIIVLLGFVGLAIDGGMVYSDRRHTQNSGDAGSLAGGGAAALDLENSHVTYFNWNCTDPRIAAAEATANNTAISRAGSNGFTIDTDISDSNGVETTCGVTPMGPYQDKYLDVQVMIQTTTQATFSSFLFDGGLVSTIEAVTRVRPRTPIAFGNAIVALNADACSGNSNGITFGGSGQTNVTGGGIFTNGCLNGNGGAFHVYVEPPYGVNYGGSWDGNGTFEPEPPQSTSGWQLPPDSYQVPVPNCGAVGAGHYNSGTHTYSPGNYSSTIRVNSGEVTFEPGLYCISASPNALVINGGNITANGVTIVAQHGDVDISGNATVNMSAPMPDPDPSPALPMVLIYLPASNASDVLLSGGGDSSFVGLVYAPAGDVTVTGNSGVNQTFHTQIIGNNVEISGNATVDIHFSTDENFQKPSAIELYR